jgi:hypothetical protein
MSSLFQILAGEMPEERRSDLLGPPTGAPTPVFHAPQGVPGEAEPLDRRRLRSNMVAVGVAGLLVLGSYGLAEGQTAFPCDPQYSFCYPDYRYYPGGGHRRWGAGGHEGWGRSGGAHYEANFGDEGHFGGFGASGFGHGGGGFEGGGG